MNPPFYFASDTEALYNDWKRGDLPYDLPLQVLLDFKQRQHQEEKYIEQILNREMT